MNRCYNSCARSRSADATSVISASSAIDHCSGVTNRESKYQGDERVFHFHTLYGDGTFDKGVLCVPDRRTLIGLVERRVLWPMGARCRIEKPTGGAGRQLDSSCR